jgi:Fe2+ or Zn2+ uptake regulation protein
MDEDDSAILDKTQLCCNIFHMPHQIEPKKRRFSRIREALLNILQHTQNPISALEIQDQLEPMLNKRPNKTTVYRELEILKANEEVMELDLLEGKKRYELGSNRRHHEHLVCIRCDYIQCVALGQDVDNLAEQISQATGFDIQDHVLEFFGTCKRCKSQSKLKQV